jgi:hypothetical protein
MQTLLAVTAGVAVLAAIAGPFYRRQSPDAQQVLMIYWACVGLATGVWLYYTWRDSWRLPEKAGAILCVLWTTGRGGVNLMSRPMMTLFLLAIWMIFIGLQSYHIAERIQVMTNHWQHMINGLAHGMMASGFLMIFVAQPFYICEKGVSIGQAVVPWNYIRSAEWIATNRSVLRLHRFDGDLFVRVPDHLRDGVQKLVAERTRFVEESSRATGQ